MSMARRLSLPLITALLVGVPVFWAFPDELSGWRSFAIVSGWIGCGLLLASLLLMIRDPWLATRLGGLERMYAWHHRLGIAAYLVLLGHPLALAADGWEERPTFAWAALDPGLQSWPGWLGWAALITMMAGMAAALAPRLPYSTWRWLHGLLAAAVAFGFAHLLLLGLDYPLLWTPLLAIAFMLWRVIQADIGVAARPYMVGQVQRPAEDIVEVSLKPLSRAISAQPGQFVLAAFLDGPRFRGCREFHPFTISAQAADGTISLGIKALGDCTRRLLSIEGGVAVRIQGPFGTFLADQTRGPSLWIAGGIGITPFLALLRTTLLAQPVRLVYLYRSERDAAYLAELQALAVTQPNLALDAIASGTGMPDLPAILPSAADLGNWDCYLCGPPGLVTAAVALLQARGVPPGRIHFERFDFR